LHHVRQAEKRRKRPKTWRGSKVMELHMHRTENDLARSRVCSWPVIVLSILGWCTSPSAGPFIPANHDGTSLDVVFRPVMLPLTFAKDRVHLAPKGGWSDNPAGPIICPIRPFGG
jgi:hypothetical protein